MLRLRDAQQALAILGAAPDLEELGLGHRWIRRGANPVNVGPCYVLRCLTM